MLGLRRTTDGSPPRPKDVMPARMKHSTGELCPCQDLLCSPTDPTTYRRGRLNAEGGASPRSRSKGKCQTEKQQKGKMRETEASHNATIIQTRFQTQCTWLPARNYNLHKNTRLLGAPGSQAASASWGILGPGSPPARDQDLDPQGLAQHAPHSHLIQPRLVFMTAVSTHNSSKRMLIFFPFLSKSLRISFQVLC